MTSSNSSSIACPPLLFPETWNCSGRGECISSVVCLCTQPNWVGQGDFAFESPTCNIYIPAVQALWSIAICFQCLIMTFSIYYLRVKLRQEELASSLPLILGVLLLLSSIFLIPTAIIRAANPSTVVIGTDTVVTVLFCCGAASFWLAVHVFVYSFLEVSYKKVLMYNTNLKHSMCSITVVKISLTITA